MSEDGDRSDEDPVDRLAESAEDREGDPFEYLTDPEADEGAGAGDRGPRDEPTRPGPDDRGDRDEAAEDEAPVDDPRESQRRERAAESTGEQVTEVSEPSVGPADPEARTGDPFSGESVFEEMDAAGLEPDQVWDELADAEERGSVADSVERTYAEVSKHSFCEVCEFFSEPPDVSCSNEGTEILEFVDMETVRVVDCPIVEERRELEREG